jgi:hypothetical protein
MRFRIPGVTTSSAVSPAVATGTDNATSPASEQKHSSDAEAANEKDVRVGDGQPRDYSSDDDSSLEKVDTNAEHGVQTIQAMTQVWSKRDILAAYVMYGPSNPIQGDR